MAQSDPPIGEPISKTDTSTSSGPTPSFWRRLLGRDHGASADSSESPTGQGSDQDQDPRAGLIRRVSRKVVPGLPRAQTFKRQQSEVRTKLQPVEQTPAERRAVSVDRRILLSHNGSQAQSDPRSSLPDFLPQVEDTETPLPSVPNSPIGEEATANNLNGLDADGFQPGQDDIANLPDAVSTIDTQSMTTSQYDQMIHEELEQKWILNLSMHFRDKSKREKFFVTYRERDSLWRRVTVSVDYRNAPDNSLEVDLVQTKFQREKSAKIYEAIRESLIDIQFYDTVTNLKLQTTEGRLHVHVVEDTNEIIHYPTVRMIQHMRCRRVKESDIQFDSHMSGFVYKVQVDGEILIKKEIPGPDTVDEFLYEINALNSLWYSKNVIKFYGVVVDESGELVKGLLISYAEQGALVDVIYDHDHSLPWRTREKWARQIVQGLSEIHEAGFVQGDFTLSNIVIDDEGNAKIIDINRRGCPVGWEPPEATPLIESNQRISMYIGVKSDLFQLGMVLWALATEEDEPESHGRPLRISSSIQCPTWYKRLVEICLSEEPRMRVQALHLLAMFPDAEADELYYGRHPSAIPVDDGYVSQEYMVDDGPTNGHPRTEVVQSPTRQPPVPWTHGYMSPGLGIPDDYYYFPTRGRSPPSPLPSNGGGCESPRFGRRPSTWSENFGAPSVSDYLAEAGQDAERSITPRTNQDSVSAPEVRVMGSVGSSLREDGETTHKLAPLSEEEDGVPPIAETQTVETTPPDAPLEESNVEQHDRSRNTAEPEAVAATPVATSHHQAPDTSSDEHLKETRPVEVPTAEGITAPDLIPEQAKDDTAVLSPVEVPTAEGITAPYPTPEQAKDDTEVLPPVSAETAMKNEPHTLAEELVVTPSTAVVIETDHEIKSTGAVQADDLLNATPDQAQAETEVLPDSPASAHLVQPSPVVEVPDELKGIGSALGAEESIRKDSLTDADFDIPVQDEPSVTPASQSAPAAAPEGETVAVHEP